jgi:hypothetical protein
VALAVVRSIRSPRKLVTAQEAEDFEQELVDQYALAMSASGVGDEHVSSHRATLFEFIRFLRRPLWTAEASDADQYLAWLRSAQGLATSTRYGKCLVLRQFYEFLMVRYQGDIHGLTGHVVGQPIDEFNQPTKPYHDVPRVPPSQAEVDELFAGWRQWLRTRSFCAKEYVSILRSRARRDGSAGLVRPRGRRPKLSAAQVKRARVWRAQGVSDVQIGARLGVSDKTAARVLDDGGPPGAVAVAVQPELDLTGVDEPEPVTACVPPGAFVPEPALAGALVGGSARIGSGSFASRYAGAMLLHAFFDRVNVAAVLSTATCATGGRYDDLAVLTGTCMAFGLGTGSLEAAKHLVRDQAGPLAGIPALPQLRTLRPRLHAIAQACDPLHLQRDLATAMIAADAPMLGVYYVDDHFVPYEGAKPVGKGWNTKRRHAQKGRADTLVTDHTGRAVCFTSGEPGGLTASLPAALANLKTITGDNKIMLGFDRGGAYPQVFTLCRQQAVDWLTYRRGALAPTTATPVRHFLGYPGAPAEALTLADETIHIDGYGTARQITLFEDGDPRLQILTSDLSANPAALLAWLRCRWRIENVFKYLAAHHGIDWLCDYTAQVHDDTRIIDNPARKAARTRLKTAQTQLADAEQALARLLDVTDRSIPLAELNTTHIPQAQQTITQAKTTVANAKTVLETIPAKIPANQATPGAQRAILSTGHRALQMVLRLLAFNAEYWLADHLNTYLRDNNEYRATTRHLLHTGGTITYTTHTITVTLDQPTTPKNTRALRLLLCELNNTPPHIPGDPRPITYTITGD